MASVAFFDLHATLGFWIFGFMNLLWLVSIKLKNSSIIDIFWGTGFVFAAWFSFLKTLESISPRDWLILILVTIWGLRLSFYILWRNAGKDEDFRYAKWRREAGASWWWKSYFKVFLLQGLIMWVIAAPLTAVQIPSANDRLNMFDFFGVLIWAIGFFFEVVGDAQLAKFKADQNNKGQLLRTGLWRYTRHPNYFGDAAQWWGFYLIALASGAWWTFFSPLWMTHFLVNVSGAAMLERTLKVTKPGYQDYVEKTNTFFPWFTKNN